MTRRPVRLAVIGCGIAAHKLHAPALLGVPRQFAVSVACSRKAPDARSFARRVGSGRLVQDWREAVVAEDVDAVLVATPVDLNKDVALAALRAGKHVLLEKPLACSLPECRALVRAAASSDRVAMLAECFRYRPTLRRLHAMIAAGTLGRITTAHWMVATEVTPANSPYARTAWRIAHRYPGGFVMDAGVHFVHALRWLFGEPVRVRSLSQSVNPAIGSVDGHTMLIETDRGVMASLALSFSTPGVRLSRLVVAGTEATAILEFNRIVLHRRRGGPRVLDIEDDGGYVDQLRAFHASITRGAPVEATFAEGMKDFAVIERSLKNAG